MKFSTQLPTISGLYWLKWAYNDYSSGRHIQVGVDQKGSFTLWPGDGETKEYLVQNEDNLYSTEPILSPVSYNLNSNVSLFKGTVSSMLKNAMIASDTAFYFITNPNEKIPKEPLDARINFNLVNMEITRKELDDSLAWQDTSVSTHLFDFPNDNLYPSLNPAFDDLVSAINDYSNIHKDKKVVIVTDSLLIGNLMIGVSDYLLSPK